MPISIQRARTKAHKLSEKLSSEEPLSKASIILLWAYLFDRINNANTDKDYESLIALSQKLSSTTGNLHSLYKKLQETHDDETIAKTLSKEAVEEIESKLKLL